MLISDDNSLSSKAIAFNKKFLRAVTRTRVSPIPQVVKTT